jgi:hypothetical protein
MSISPGGAAFKLTYELSPIILTGGIASFIPGGMLPIISITEPLNFVDGILSGGGDLDLDDFFAHFVPLPGSGLVSQELGEYPFANQAVAANAVIRKPLTISLRMICPVKDTGWSIKLATMTALKTTLNLHNASGGTYTVATPSYFYVNCILMDLRDVSAENSRQPQNTYQWDFRQPLLTLDDAISAQNNLMSIITAGTPISGVPAWSGLSPTVGIPPSLGAIGTLPAASGPAGASAAIPFADTSGPL